MRRISLSYAEGVVYAWQQSEDGDPFTVGHELVDFQRFDTAEKAKQAAAETLRFRMADQAETDAANWRRNWVETDLSN